MKFKFIVLFLLIGCSSQDPEETTNPDDEQSTEDEISEERQTYPTPSKSDNVRNPGCVSVVYINGKKEVFPCAGRQAPHGPIYEFDKSKFPPI